MITFVIFLIYSLKKIFLFNKKGPCGPFLILKLSKNLVACVFSILKLSGKLLLVDIPNLKLLRQLVAGAFKKLNLSC